MRTLSDDQQRRTPVGAPRSGGRTVARGGGISDAGASVTRGAAGVRGARGARGRDGTGGRDGAGGRDGGEARGTRVEHLVAGATALKVSARQVEPDQSRPDERPGTGLRAAPPAPVRAPRAPFVVLVLFIVIVGVVGILVLNIKINANQFELSNLEQRQKSLDIRQGQYEKEIAEREAPGTLAGQAAELGMKPPTKPPTFIVLPDDRKLDMPQPAVGK